MNRALLSVCIAFCLVGCSDKSESTKPPLNKLVGTWQESKNTNSWVRFMPDGKFMAQDETKDLALGDYTVLSSSNMVVAVEGTNVTIGFYFPSPNEVILEGLDGNHLFKRAKSN